MHLTHLASRIYGTPLLISRTKLDVILSVLGTRIGLPETEAASPFVISPEEPVEPVPGIAVIPIHGSLVRRGSGIDAMSGLTSYRFISDQIEAALAEPEVDGIFLDVDSPGGESGGVFELADQIRAANDVKPVWAHANDAAFSAAYALAAAASRLTLSRTAGVGSIGVIALHVDQSKRDSDNGIEYTAIYAGERKNDLTPHAPISTEAAAGLQAEVDRLYDIFVRQMAEFRGIDVKAIRATEAGLYFGENAIRAGLADGISTMEDVLAEFSQHLAQRATSPATGSQLLTPTIHPQEPAMQPEMTKKPTTDGPAPEASPDVPAPVAQTTEPFEMQPDNGRAEAQAIAELCLLAGCPERTNEFLASNMSEAEVRKVLMDARADQPEVSSQITVDAGIKKSENPEDSPLMAAAKKLANQE